jgi:hypothetical protein
VAPNSLGAASVLEVARTRLFLLIKYSKAASMNLKVKIAINNKE